MKLWILGFNKDNKKDHGRFRVIGSMRSDFCARFKQPADRQVRWDVEFALGYKGYPFDGVVTAFPYIFCDEPTRAFFESIEGVRLQKRIIYEIPMQITKSREEIMGNPPFPCDWIGDRYLIDTDQVLDFSGDFMQPMGTCPECGGEHFQCNPEGELLLHASKDPVLFKLKGLEDSYLFATETFLKRLKKEKVLTRKPDYFTLPIRGDLKIG